MSDETKEYITAQGHWWAVVALYTVLQPASHSRYRSKRLGERRVILVDAADEAEAQQIGLELAQEYESRYRNGDGDLICWKLQRIEEVYRLGTTQIGHGAEVYNAWLSSGKARRRRPPEGWPKPCT